VSRGFGRIRTYTPLLVSCFPLPGYHPEGLSRDKFVLDSYLVVKVPRVPSICLFTSGSVTLDALKNPLGIFSGSKGKRWCWISLVYSRSGLLRGERCLLNLFSEKVGEITVMPWRGLRFGDLFEEKKSGNLKVRSRFFEVRSLILSRLSQDFKELAFGLQY
jgi:hypothetical protein